MRKPKMHFILLLLLLSVLSSSVGAGTLGDLTYKIAEGQVAITDCSESAEGELVIPNKIEGLPVTSIGDYAFTRCDSLTSITIPEGVTSIGEGAFYYCTSLTSITISEGVISIGYYAFTDCRSLTSITIPEGVKSIGYYAFNGCSSLTSITIPNSVTSIGPWAFEGCVSLTSISVTSGNELYKSLDGVVFSKDLKELLICPTGKLGHYTIPEGVTSIGNGAFSYCTSLTSITIGDSVTSIGDRAFEGCGSLTSITIPNSVTSIGDGAFWECTSLTSITIGDSVTSIGEAAFYYCTSLTSITIPEGVTSIGDRAFYWCISLTSITIPEAFHSKAEAIRLIIRRLWPDGFFIPSSVTRTPELSIRLPLQLILTGAQKAEAVIEVTKSLNQPWAEWRTVVIGEDGWIKIDLDEGTERRFYRVRE